MIDNLNMNQYPLIQEYFEKGVTNIEYIKELSKSVRKQLETRRYYKMKYNGKFVPYITDADVYEEIELFLQVAPRIFMADMELFANGGGQFSGTTK